MSKKRRDESGLSGVAVVNKPEGVTSHDVVNKLRKLYGTRRVGHAGTLDPLATGVLVVCVGDATRIAEYLAASHKTYVAGVVFGVATDTEDATGHTIAEMDTYSVSEESVRGVASRFLGPIMQTPPMVSAVHHEGVRLYELARRGIEVTRQPRRVEIESIDLLSFTEGARARATFRITCSAGTYIRTLAANIGEALGVGGMMESLNRERSGRFSIADAYTIDDVQHQVDAGNVATTLHSISSALADWRSIELTGEEADRVRHGRAVDVRDSLDENEMVVLLAQNGAAVALAKVVEGVLHPTKVFNAECSPLIPRLQFPSE